MIEGQDQARSDAWADGDCRRRSGSSWGNASPCPAAAPASSARAAKGASCDSPSTSITSPRSARRGRRASRSRWPPPSSPNWPAPQGITVHLRGDRRHIKERDVELLRQVVSTKLNVEMAATAEMTGIAAAHPARPGDAGAGAAARADDRGRPRRAAPTARRSRDAVAALRAAGIRVSIFIDPDPAQVKASKEVGADAIEINTGALRGRVAGASGRRAWQRVREAAAAAAGAGPRGPGRPRPHLRQRPPDRRHPRHRGAQHRPQHRRARVARRARAGGARDGRAAGVAAVRRAVLFAALFASSPPARSGRHAAGGDASEPTTA